MFCCISNSSAKLTLLDTRTYSIKEDFQNILITGKGSIPANVEIDYYQKPEQTTVYFKLHGKDSSELANVETLSAEVVNNTLTIVANSKQNDISSKNFIRSVKSMLSSDINVKIALSKKSVDTLQVLLHGGACKITRLDVKESAKIDTPAGAIEITDMNVGILDINTAAGVILLSNIKAEGNISAESAAGKIQFTDVVSNGKCEGTTAAGGIHFQNVIAKDIVVESAAGSIIANASGFNSFSAEAAFGEIKTVLDVSGQTNPKLTFEVATGSITSQIKGFQGSFKIESAVGSTSVQGANEDIKSKKGSVGKGSGVVNVESALGSVNLTFL